MMRTICLYLNGFITGYGNGYIYIDIFWYREVKKIGINGPFQIKVE